jgi:Tfp pilus assembly protein PilF
MQKLLGDLSGAEAAYRESLRVDPDNPDTHLQLGHLLRLRGAAASAEAAYRAALAIDPNFAAAQEALSAPELATAEAWHERAAETREAAG